MDKRIDQSTDGRNRNSDMQAEKPCENIRLQNSFEKIGDSSPNKCIEAVNKGKENAGANACLPALQIYGDFQSGDGEKARNINGGTIASDESKDTGDENASSAPPDDVLAGKSPQPSTKQPIRLSGYITVTESEPGYLHVQPKTTPKDITTTKSAAPRAQTARAPYEADKKITHASNDDNNQKPNEPFAHKLLVGLPIAMAKRAYVGIQKGELQAYVADKVVEALIVSELAEQKAASNTCQDVAQIYDTLKHPESIPAKILNSGVAAFNAAEEAPGTIASLIQFVQRNPEAAQRLACEEIQLLNKKLADPKTRYEVLANGVNDVRDMADALHTAAELPHAIETITEISNALSKIQKARDLSHGLNQRVMQVPGALGTIGECLGPLVQINRVRTAETREDAYRAQEQR